jgi:hypothetical protein
VDVPNGHYWSCQLGGQFWFFFRAVSLPRLRAYWEEGELGQCCRDSEDVFILLGSTEMPLGLYVTCHCGLDGSRPRVWGAVAHVGFLALHLCIFRVAG